MKHVKLPNFDEYFIVRSVGVGLWQVFNKATNETVSPQCSDIDAAIYFVERELMQEIEDKLHEMLDEHICSGS